MKSRTLTFITAITLFAALAIPLRLPAQQHTLYKLIDIGTFGGPESFINPTAAIGSPDQINSAGTTVGGAGTLTPTPTNTFNPVICGGFEGFPWLGVNHAFKWQDGVLTDLGSLIGRSSSGIPSVSTPSAFTLLRPTNQIPGSG